MKTFKTILRNIVAGVGYAVFVSLVCFSMGVLILATNILDVLFGFFGVCIGLLALGGMDLKIRSMKQENERR